MASAESRRALELALFGSDSDSDIDDTPAQKSAPRAYERAHVPCVTCGPDSSPVSIVSLFSLTPLPRVPSFAESWYLSDAHAVPACVSIERDVGGVAGLVVARHAITAEDQLAMLAAIDALRLFPTRGHNQAMRFGADSLPGFALWLSGRIAKLNASQETALFCGDIAAREPLFDQMISNCYHPGEGISSHVDLLKFEDGVVSLSLGSPCVMDFVPADVDDLRMCGDGNCAQGSLLSEKGGVCGRDAFGVLLNPGDIVALSGPARYAWKHGIAQRGFDVWDAATIPRGHRISVTLRRLTEAACG